MNKYHLVLLPVIKPVDLHEIEWLTQIYIFVFIKTLKDVWVIQCLTLHHLSYLKRKSNHHYRAILSATCQHYYLE